MAILMGLLACGSAWGVPVRELKPLTDGVVMVTRPGKTLVLRSGDNLLLEVQ